MVKSSCRRPKLLSAPTGGLTASVTPVPGNPLPLGECLCGYCMHRAHRYTCRQNIHRCKIKMNKKRLRPHSGYSLVKLIPRSGHSQIHTVCSVNAEDPPPLLSASPAACLLGAPPRSTLLARVGRQQGAVPVPAGCSTVSQISRAPEKTSLQTVCTDPAQRQHVALGIRT